MPTTLDTEFLQQTQLYRPGRRDIDTDFSSGCWAAPVDRLLAAGYSFLPCRYDDGGYLYRGLQGGLSRALDEGVFGHFDGADEMCGVEQAMGVYFLTSEISDAVTVARLHETPADAAVIAVPAARFNARLDRGTAAVLAVGDGGIVFRYPFVTQPLPAADVARVFLSAHHAERLPADHPLAGRVSLLEGDTRKDLETGLRAGLQRLGMSDAMAVHSSRYPRRDST